MTGRTLLAAAALAAATLVPTAQAAKPRADLTISKAAPSVRSVAPGGQISVTWTIKNGGKAAAAKSTIELALSTDAKLDAADLRLGSFAQKAIKARKTATGTLKATVPARAAARRYSLLVCADTKGKVKESKETNNCRTAAAIDVVAAAAPVVRRDRPRRRSPGRRRCRRTRRRQPQPTHVPAAHGDARRPRRSRRSSPRRPQDISPLQSARFAFTANEAVDRLRVPARRRRVHTLHLAARDPEHPRRRARLRGPRAPRRRRTRRPPARRGGSSSRRPRSARPTRPQPPREPGDDGRRRRDRRSSRDTTEFLYTGANPIQKDVEADAIESNRAAVLRGRSCAATAARSTASASRSSITPSSAAPPRAPTAASRSPSTAAAR